MSNDWNPRLFGAVGDGVTDDSPAFDAMLAAIPSTIGGSVSIPPGFYYLSRDLNIRRFVLFRGAGGGLSPNAPTKFKLAAGAQIITHSNPSFTPGISTAQFSTLSNFNVYGTAPPSWLANHAYVVGDVVKNTLFHGGFTQYVYVCTSAGTSAGIEPRLAHIRQPSHP